MPLDPKELGLENKPQVQDQVAASESVMSQPEAGKGSRLQEINQAIRSVLNPENIASTN